MIAFFVVTAGFPIFALPITAMAVGLILGLFAQGFMASVIYGFQSLVRWTFDLFPWSWTFSHREDLGDGTGMDHYTWFGDILNFIEELVMMIPTHDVGVVVTSVIGYCIFEFLVLFFFLKAATRKKGRMPVINEQEQRMF